jgi:hypothetical protein
MRLAIAAISVQPSESYELEQHLEAARSAVERRFLEAGDVLGQAVDCLGRLMKSANHLTENLDSEAVVITIGELKRAAADLLALPAQHADRLKTIDRLMVAGEQLASGIAEMRRNLAYLRVFAIDIKIAASSIVIGRQEFGSFAQEICDRIELGSTYLNAFDADLQALRRIFKAGAGHETLLIDHCQSMMATAPEGLASTAAGILTHHQHIVAIAADVEALARSIQKKVGTALGGLQIGDITRQRVEHIEQALVDLRAVQDLTAEQRGRMSRCVHSLLAEQLSSTAADFHRDVAKIALSMGGIAGDAAALLSIGHRSVARSDGDDLGFLRVLEHHVGQALSLVEEMAVADQQAQDVGCMAAAATGRLGGQITELQGIKTDVQEMALNTTLRCYRIGDMGKPLSVIAVELRAYAGHMETATKQALLALVALSTDARVLAADTDSGNVTLGVGAALTGASLRLKQAANAMEADLSTLAGEGRLAMQSLQQAAGRVDLEVEIGAVLDDAASALMDYAGEDAPEIDDVQAPLGKLLGDLFKRYTMAQERAVHTAFAAALDLPAADAPSAAISVAAAGPADPDDVFF